MEFAVVHTSLLILSFILCISFLFRGKKYSNRLPPGSFGLPVIGQTQSFLKAMKDDKLKEWFEERIRKHGPIWKSHLFGYPTIYLDGQKANKFLYSFDGNGLINSQPAPTTKIMGKKILIVLDGPDHKRIRTAMISFLKLEVLKLNVPNLDEEMQHHLQMHWHGKHEVQVQPLLKILTFDMICSMLLGVERGPKRERLLPLFEVMFEAILAIPINFPFTTFNRGLTAKKKLIPMIVDLIHEKEEALKQNQVDTHKDLITRLLSIRDEDTSSMISNEEIIDNFVVVMAAGYETTSTLLTFFVRLLASNKSIYNSVVQEHEEIANSKPSGEALTWENLSKMNYTWSVASELLRMYTPAPLSHRRAIKDIEYEGFIIPKGWQVIMYSGMTHMDDNIFRNPSKFDPSRFEKHAPPPPPCTFVPFGAGPRMCPGMEFAKIETLVAIHHLVTRFTWELLNEDESYKRIPSPTFDQGLLARIKPIK